MEKELLQRLDLLAEKLGVASGHLWEILAKQAKIEFFTDAAALLVVCLVAFFCTKHRSHISKWVQDGYDGREAIAFFSAAIFIIIFVLAVAGAITSSGYLFNPEYFALKQILEIAK